MPFGADYDDKCSMARHSALCATALVLGTGFLTCTCKMNALDGAGATVYHVQMLFTRARYLAVSVRIEYISSAMRCYRIKCVDAPMCKCTSFYPSRTARSSKIHPIETLIVVGYARCRARRADISCSAACAAHAPIHSSCSYECLLHSHGD